MMDRLKKLYFSPSIRHAIKTALAAVITTLLCQQFHFPKGYWAVVTAVIVMQANIEKFFLWPYKIKKSL